MIRMSMSDLERTLWGFEVTLTKRDHGDCDGKLGEQIVVTVVRKLF